ncbi:MAG TPA: alpha-glucosidase/alpha-galactosidase [Clostridia bacterium]
MTRITFLGAGSTVFAKNVLGDCILTPEIPDLEISLHDIDPIRLDDSRRMIENIARNAGRPVRITADIDRRSALRNADFVVNAIQVGGYEPCTVTDFEIPKRYGFRQTIGDTTSIGGIFRALRTIPVLDAFAEDISAVCPQAFFINYTNPMSMLTGYLQRFTGLRSVGLCHSVQVCARDLLRRLDMSDRYEGCRWEISGVNHMAWLLRIEDRNGADLYPEIRRRAAAHLAGEAAYPCDDDLVRLDLMLRFGYYVTESSEHNAEYHPYYIKSAYPELIERFNIPLDEYPRRCIRQIEAWKNMRAGLVEDGSLKHEKTHEFASYIIRAMATDEPYRVHGNVLNTGLIPNLPSNACVEVPCMVDRTGLHPCFAGDLPEQCAALNRLAVNVHLMTIEAAHTRRKDAVYMAAMLDPRLSSELTADQIRSMCDDLFSAHGDWLPRYS